MRRPTVPATALLLATLAAAPTTAPATRPTTAAAKPDTTAVKRDTLRLSFDLDGTFEPIDPFEVVVEAKRYSGDLTITRAVRPDTSVAKGDVLLTVDTDPIDRQIAAADVAATVARAGVAKAESDVALGEVSDGAAMAVARQSADDAAAGLKRWDAADGQAVVASAKLQAKQYDDALDDATDELDQLRQMYKSEDLTNKTADIVLKRAVHTQELYRAMGQIVRTMTDRATTYAPTVERHQMAAGVDAQARAVDKLAAAQAQEKVARTAAVATARAAASEADRALAELKADRAKLTITSPIDGVVVYGSFAHKAWSPMEAKKLAVGEKVTDGAVVMTVYQPGRLKVAAACPEGHLSAVPPGTPVAVRADALPAVSYAGTAGAASPYAGPDHDGSATHSVAVTVPAVDPRIAPGYGCTVAVDVPPSVDVVVVPASAVWHGKVWVRQPDGTDRPTPVTVGRRDADQVEIRSGVVAGDRVVTKPKGM